MEEIDSKKRRNKKRCFRFTFSHFHFRLYIWPRGGVATQGTANPRTPVQFRARPQNYFARVVEWYTPALYHLAISAGQARGIFKKPKWRNGIRARLKISWSLLYVGSSPTFGTCCEFLPRICLHSAGRVSPRAHTKLK